jgi:nucleotide-binding universal stress UspA family protein
MLVRRGEDEEADRNEAYDTAVNRMTAYLEKQAKSLRKAGVKTRTEVRFGEPKQVIPEAAEALGADAIVMATHGRSGLSRLVFGSVASAVLQHGGRPVLLVRPRE